MTTLLLAFAAAILAGPAKADDTAEQHLKQAETQRQIVYAQLESKLTTEQKTKLEAAEKAWSRFTKLEVENQSQELDRSTSRGQEALHELSAALTWSRVSHLRRMLAPVALAGVDSDFRDADGALNKIYKDRRRLLERREPFEAMRQAQLAWIRYRDTAAESESSVCPDSVSAAVRIKTELTYERGLFLRWTGGRLARRLATAPPDLENEQYLAQLLSDSAEVRQGAIGFFAARADSVLPLLLEQARIGLLPVHAAPIFQKLGLTAIEPLFALTDNRDFATFVLPKLIAGIAPAALPELQKRASGNDVATAIVAVGALYELGPRAKDALPALLDITRNAGAVTLRVAAGGAALHIEPDNPDVAKAIVDGYLTAPTDGYIFSCLLSTLGPRARAALPTLAKQARNPATTGEIMGAIAAMISPDDAEVVPTLVEILVAPDTQYWEGCARALTKAGASAAPALAKLLQSNDIGTLRRVATVLVGIKPVSQETLACLMARVNGEDVVTSVTFIDILAGAGRDAIPVLLEALKGGKPGRSTAALYALHAIAPELVEVKQAWLPKPYVVDPYYDAQCYRLPDNATTGPHYAIRADFNNDGVEDVAVSDTGFGTGGGGWCLCLKVADGKYKAFNEIEAPREVTLFSGGQRGVGYMRVYWHMSAGTGSETLLKVTMDGVTCIKSVDVEWTEKDAEVPIDRNEKIPAPEGCTPTKIAAVPIDANYLLGLQATAKSGDGKK